METSNVLTSNKWNYELEGGSRYFLYKTAHLKNFGECKWNVLSISHVGESAKENAELIVTAVNACKAINGANPLAAANSLQKMYNALNTIKNAFWSDGESLEYRIADLKDIAAEALKQATE